VLESDRPIAQMAADLGIHREALRLWVRQAEADAGQRPEDDADALFEALSAILNSITADQTTTLYRAASRLLRTALVIG
jgi:transposase-like protein